MPGTGKLRSKTRLESSASADLRRSGERGAEQADASADLVASLKVLQQRPSAPSMEPDTAPFRDFTTLQNRRSALYTPEQRVRRDQSVWTLVQAILAPLQFALFLVSLVLVLRYMTTGQGLALATGSAVAKTLALYAIMITGSIWERQVFGCYLFARPFFWEDVFSMLVLALHTAYLVALATGALGARALMVLLLAAYASYVINAAQFILKLRSARLEGRSDALACGMVTS
jgi:3-vinyl bacteriochlorophyllide hydratase